MKKLLTLILAAAGGLMSLQAAQPVVGPTTPLKSKADSLAYYLGASQGASFNATIRRQAQPEQYGRVRANYLAGVQAALDADTSAVEYYDGFNVGRQMVEAIKEMKANGFPVNMELFRRSLTDAYLNDGITEDDIQSLMTSVQTIMTPIGRAIDARRGAARDAERQQMTQAAEANRAAGKRYVDSIKKADKGYVESATGLVYKIEKPGNGPKLTAKQNAHVRYTGKFVDGRMFDSSGDNTVTLGPSGVIKGFGEGLQLLGKGGKATLVIPSGLAYGDNAPPVIGPGQTLIFDIEIDDILPE